MIDNFQREEILKSFRIVIDTREHDTKAAKKRYKSFGVPFERHLLDYGDYCGQITLPGGDLYTGERFRPDAYIERKMSLDELASCLTSGRDRFQREFTRAQGAKGYLLIEGGSYESILNHRYRSRFHPNAFLASLVAWSIRYNLTPVFCKPDTAGRMIKEILYREMKEPLENGKYG